MKNLIIIILLVFASNLYSQKIYNSSITTSYNSKAEIIEKTRMITISDTKVTISNFVGGSELLELTVNQIKEKEDWWDSSITKWYYCTTTTKDRITGKFTEFIIILEKSYPSSMDVHQKLDEVTFIKTVLSLE